jgi:hypothetical protein
MMDELTPEEIEALKSLPRERMPSAGLEERVVGAMRGRGVLAARRPARVVRITTARVAGLLAACVALMIGAYSIGVQRGSFRPEVREALEPRTTSLPATDESVPSEERARVIPPAATPPEPGLVKQTPSPRANEGKMEPTKDRGSKLEDSAARADMAVSSEAEAKIGSAGRNEPAPAMKALAARESVPESPARTFQLGGSAFVVDAPDSVRIIEDAQGRMLLIYTSDGLIRIRLAD